MKSRFGQDQIDAPRRLRRVVVTAALAVGMIGLPVLTVSATTAGAATGTVIVSANTSFGKALVVGSGPYTGFSLYMISSDHGTTFGCTATPVSTIVGILLCTGPSNDQNAEWPALTTQGAPIAGPGVSQALLGTVHRAKVGDQVTYAGHPLYLFDRMPGAVNGEGWNEASLPPWHGIWDLVSPSGRALPWAGMLTTTRIHGRNVLAAQMLVPIGWIDFPVYSYTKDTSTHSACRRSCAIAWPAVLTSGTPGVSKGLSASSLGTLHTPEGLQASYDGKPLYLFGFEGIAVTPTGIVPTGSGDGITVNGGTFNLITP